MPRFSDALARLWPRSRETPAHVKASATGPLIAFETLGRPVWTPRDYAAFAREGFMQNAIVYRSVRMVAEAAASIPILLYEGDEEIEEHPLLDLVKRPSPDHTSADFFETWYGFLLVAGNAYAEAVAAGGRLRELHVLRPDRMKVVPGADGWPEAYEYTVAGSTVPFAAEPAAGVRPILHVRLFHPANDHYGMSPIEAAASAIDLHNTAARWNKALLDNSARPSGALVYSAAEGRMTAEQFARLKTELEEGFQGSKQAGRPLLLEGGLDWKPLGLSPKDMDFVEARRAAAREIALALGVPPMLLGIPGDNTYSNYQEATRSFWRQTVLPLVARTLKSFSMWLAPAYGGSLELKADLDQVEALTSEREALWARIDKVSFLTLNEKRAAVGYGPVEGGDAERPPSADSGASSVSRKYRPDQARAPRGDPDGGQWVDEGGGGGGSSGSRSRSDALSGSRNDGSGARESERVRVAQAGGGNRSRRSAALVRFPEASPAQEVRLTVAENWARDVVSRIQALDPNWRPRQSLTSSTIEGAISRAEAHALEAETRLEEIRSGEERSGSGDSRPRTLDEVCRPEGGLVGKRKKGADFDTTTVSRSEFDRLMRELTSGATEVESIGRYKGLWYKRSDGTTIGIRRSKKSGLTIDIIDSLENPELPSGTRIHFDD